MLVDSVENKMSREGLVSLRKCPDVLVHSLCSLGGRKSPMRVGLLLQALIKHARPHRALKRQYDSHPRAILCSISCQRKSAGAVKRNSFSLFTSLEFGVVTPGSSKVKLLVDYHGSIDSVVRLAQILFVNGKSTAVLYNGLVGPDFMGIRDSAIANLDGPPQVCTKIPQVLSSHRWVFYYIYILPSYAVRDYETPVY